MSVFLRSVSRRIEHYSSLGSVMICYKYGVKRHEVRFSYRGIIWDFTLC